MFELDRRNFLAFLGVAGGATLIQSSRALAANPGLTNSAFPGGAFTSVRLPHDLPWYTNNPSYLPSGIGSGVVANYPDTLGAYTVFDDLVVPPEFGRYVIVSWGDRVFADPEEYFGYNCDYTSYVPVNGETSGYLTVNHEYISFPMAFDAPEAPSSLKSASPAIKTTALDVLGEDLDAQPQLYRWGEFLYNLGLSVVRIRKRNSGQYKPEVADPNNRRIHGLSGLGRNGQRTDLRPDGMPYAQIRGWGPKSYQKGKQDWLVATGPAVHTVYPRSVDGMNRKIIGTSYNCSGCSTPWGTTLSCEENFQGGTGAFFIGVQEWMKDDGTQIGWIYGDAADVTTYTTGTYFGLVGEKYGLVVEIDPKDPTFRPVKHTALGRFRHENVAMRCEAGNKLICYMGDDRRAGHTWKFVSKETVVDPTSRDNTYLLHVGTLYAAKFNADGTGEWIALKMSTPVAPNKPSDMGSQDPVNSDTVKKLELPSRAGIAGATGFGAPIAVNPTNEATVLAEYITKGNTKAQATLGDYYTDQGAILMDGYLAANLAGATSTARPEDLEISPFDPGVVFIAYTDGIPGTATGEAYPDSRIFQVAKYGAEINATQAHGGLYKIVEDSTDGTGTTFTWERFLQGGEAGADLPIDCAGFAQIDNMVFDAGGNLWLVTDMSTSRHNGFSTSYSGATLQPGLRTINHVGAGSGDALVGVFGNNWMFYVPVTGANAGTVVPFGYGPTRCEMTGPTFVGDTLIVSVQHPGEDSPINGDPNAGGVAASTIGRSVEMLRLDGSTVYNQTRYLPRGSNFPTHLPTGVGGSAIPVANAPAPKPSVMGIRRK